MDPVSMIKTLISLGTGVKAVLEQAEENEDTCKQLIMYLEISLRVLKSLQERIKETPNDTLSTFLTGMEGILNKIQKITCKITQKKSKVDKLKKIVMATTYQEELQEIRTLMDSLHKQSQWLILDKVYEVPSAMKRKHVHSARRIQYRSLPYEDVCFFCHVLDEESVIIGGQQPGQITWELVTYNIRSGNEKTGETWKCPSDMGQPADITHIEIKERDFLVVLLEDENRILLFDKTSRLFLPDPLYIFPDTEYAARRLTSSDHHRLVVSLDPCITANPSLKTQIQILKREGSTFKCERTIELDCLDTHSLASISESQVVVVCGRPERIKVFDIDDWEMKWQLKPEKICDIEVFPEDVCEIGGPDLLVYDSVGKRIVSAFKYGWADKPLMRDSYLGEYVFGMARIPGANRIVVLHHVDDEVRMSWFGFEMPSPNDT